VRDTIVTRGQQPMPVRTPLPLRLPEELAVQIAHARNSQP